MKVNLWNLNSIAESSVFLNINITSPQCFRDIFLPVLYILKRKYITIKFLARKRLKDLYIFMDTYITFVYFTTV